MTEESFEESSANWNYDEVKKEFRKLSILKLLASYKFVFFCFVTATLFHLLIWVLFGGIEEGIHSAQSTSGRVFMEEGGLFVFNRGCKITSTAFVIIAVNCTFYIALEIIACVLWFKTERDTWNTKSESVAVIVIQVIAVPLFIVLGFIPLFSQLLDYFVPYVMVLNVHLLLEILICVTLPIIYAIVGGLKKMRNSNSSSEKLLKNKKAFSIILDFARRSYCPEGILCWSAIQTYKKTRKEKRKKVALEIVSIYLDPDSPFEINIPRSEVTKKEILEKLENPKTLTSSLFDSVESNCLLDLKDILDRLHDPYIESLSVN